MKPCLSLLALCVFASVGASGQTASTYWLSGQPQMLIMPEHPLHATQTPLAQEQDLREHSGYTYAAGERSAWEYMPAPRFEPIADLARAFKDEHVMAKKAVVVWNDEDH